jgi:hypothetical protein
MSDEIPRRNTGPLGPLEYLPDILNHYDDMWVRTVNALIIISNVLQTVSAIPEGSKATIEADVADLLESYTGYQQFRTRLMRETGVDAKD